MKKLAISISGGGALGIGPLAFMTRMEQDFGKKLCDMTFAYGGTSTGSVAAVAPVLVPLAASLNVDVGLMCGAIISGAIFGDNAGGGAGRRGTHALPLCGTVGGGLGRAVRVVRHEDEHRRSRRAQP